MPRDRIRVVLAGRLILLLVTTAPVAAQGPIRVEAADAQKHLATHVDPVYPAIAKAARVQGQVEIAIVIDSDGKVASEKVVNGPPMLRQAALDAIQKWQFKPFEIHGDSDFSQHDANGPLFSRKAKGWPYRGSGKSSAGMVSAVQQMSNRP